MINITYLCSECESELIHNEDNSCFICPKCGRKREFKKNTKIINMNEDINKHNQVLYS